MKNVEDRAYSTLVKQLAGHPGIVVIATGVASIVVSCLVFIWNRPDVLTTVATIATVWALFLALGIYLLTAHDTDRVVEEIDDLREQLTAALAVPDVDDDVEEYENEEPVLSPTQSSPDQPAPAQPAPKQPVPVESEHHIPATSSSSDPRKHQRTQAERDLARRNNRFPQVNMIKIPQGPKMPDEYMSAWKNATELDESDITLAWTRDGRGRAPWVIGTEDGRVWSVFARGGSEPSVIPLSGDWQSIWSSLRAAKRDDQRQRQKELLRNTRRSGRSDRKPRKER